MALVPVIPPKTQAYIAVQHRFYNACWRDAAMRKMHGVLHELFNFG
jgi:hypothetical protein